MNDGNPSNFDAPPPEESSNRTFLIAAGILGGIVLLSIACLAGYALIILPSQREHSAASRHRAGSSESAGGAGVDGHRQRGELPICYTDPPADANTGGRAANVNHRTGHEHARSGDRYGRCRSDAGCAGATDTCAHFHGIAGHGLWRSIWRTRIGSTWDGAGWCYLPRTALAGGFGEIVQVTDSRWSRLRSALR